MSYYEEGVLPDAINQIQATKNQKVTSIKVGNVVIKSVESVRHSR